VRAVSDREYLGFDGEVRRTTEKAILFYIEAADEEVWLPLSQVELSDDETSVLVPRWLAVEKGLT
jgi:hypothetical protein